MNEDRTGEDKRHDVLDVAEDLLNRNNLEKVRASRHSARFNGIVLMIHVALSVVTLVVVLAYVSHEHTLSIQQAQKAPGEISAIINRAVCPIVRAVSSVHDTPLRAALIKKYC
jgi:hypothetical protein